MAAALHTACRPIALGLGLGLLLGVVVHSRAENDVHKIEPKFYAQLRELVYRHALKGSPCCAALLLGEDRMAQDITRRRLDSGEQVPPGPAPLTPVAVLNWPLHGAPPLGQVAGVAVAPNGFPVVFHRGARVFNSASFNDSHHFQFVEDGAIPEDTVLTLDPDNGDVLAGWGRDLFYMPHSITIDNRGNTWVTDVALHQVLKFPPGEVTPSLQLGERLAPGSGKHQLCMPTDVAVASTGEVFVGDGYCNARVLKFDPAGVLIRTYPQSREVLPLQVPHSVALLERLDLVCIADRENMRVVCPPAELRAERPAGASVIQAPELGRVFGVAAYGDFLYAVNGYTAQNIPVQGFTLDPVSESIIDRWGPPQGMNNPHSLAVSPDGTALYVAEIGPNRVWKFALTQS